MFMPTDTGGEDPNQWYESSEQADVEIEPEDATEPEKEYMHMGSNKDLEKTLLDTRNQLDMASETIGILRQEINDLKGELVAKDVIFEDEIENLIQQVALFEDEPSHNPPNPHQTQNPVQNPQYIQNPHYNPNPAAMYNQAPAYQGFRFH